jgi:hypothetical protein
MLMPSFMKIDLLANGLKRRGHTLCPHRVYLYVLYDSDKPITVAGPRTNTEIVDSNPTQGMDVCIVCVYSVFVLFCA